MQSPVEFWPWQDPYYNITALPVNNIQRLLLAGNDNCMVKILIVIITAVKKALQNKR